MAHLLRSPPAIGLLFGMAIPPAVTKMYLEPSLIHQQFRDLDELRHTLDYIGWHVRTMEESRGFKDEDIYIPATYYQGHY